MWICLSKIVFETLFDQIANVCETSILYLRIIMKNKRMISATSLKCTVYLCAVDWIPTMLHYIIFPNYNLQQLKRAQNWAAKVMLGEQNAITCLLFWNNAFWLPFVKQINFKMRMLCCCCMNNCSSVPQFLAIPSYATTQLRLSGGGCWNYSFYVRNNFDVSVPFLLEPPICGTICPLEPESRIQLIISVS